MPAGGSTLAHYHRASEEVYLVTSGSGRLRLGDEVRRSARRLRRDPTGDAERLFTFHMQPR